MTNNKSIDSCMEQEQGMLKLQIPAHRMTKPHLDFFIPPPSPDPDWPEWRSGPPAPGQHSAREFTT